MIGYTIDEKQGLTVMIKGEIDHHTASEIRKQTDELIFKYLPKNLILDFSQVTFCDSSGIAIVLGRYKLMKQYGGVVNLAKVNSQISRIFDVSGVWNIIGRKEFERK
ncbi:MAG: anti-sigma factor antagonist [Clostridia bacterium]|nr:anti-sigma factor antagonist [Clostridia bacterium]